jgi:GTP cyclohydrolase II
MTTVARARLPLANAQDTHVLAFRPANGGRENLALIVGSPEPPGPVLVRLHSECLTGDLLGSLKCDCGDQLRGAIAAIGEAGSGILLYLAQEGRGIGLINKLRAYELQDQGFDTIEANQRLGFEADEREFAAAAEMLKYLGFAQVRLLTNNPDKVAALSKYGIEVVERVAHHFPTNPHNEAYLATKKAKAGHTF